MSQEIFYETSGWIIKGIVSQHFHLPLAQTQSALEKGLDLVARARYHQTLVGSSYNISVLNKLIELALPLFFQSPPL